jgi:ribosome-associated protein
MVKTTKTTKTVKSKKPAATRRPKKKDKDEAKAKELLGTIIKGIQEKKGREIISMDFSKVGNNITDYFVVCDGNSNVQVSAIADSVEAEVKKSLGIRPWHKEGFENAEWILLDYIDVVVHIFQENSRKFYQLESLWADADISKIEEKPAKVK